MARFWYDPSNNLVRVEEGFFVVGVFPTAPGTVEATLEDSLIILRLSGAPFGSVSLRTAQDRDGNQLGQTIQEAFTALQAILNGPDTRPLYVSDSSPPATGSMLFIGEDGTAQAAPSSIVEDNIVFPSGTQFQQDALDIGNIARLCSVGSFINIKNRATGERFEIVDYQSNRANASTPASRLSYQATESTYTDIFTVTTADQVPVNERSFDWNANFTGRVWGLRFNFTSAVTNLRIRLIDTTDENNEQTVWTYPDNMAFLTGEGGSDHAAGVTEIDLGDSPLYAPITRSQRFELLADSGTITIDETSGNPEFGILRQVAERITLADANDDLALFEAEANRALEVRPAVLPVSDGPTPRPTYLGSTETPAELVVNADNTNVITFLDMSEEFFDWTPTNDLRGFDVRFRRPNSVITNLRGRIENPDGEAIAYFPSAEVWFSGEGGTTLTAGVGDFTVATEHPFVVAANTTYRVRVRANGGQLRWQGPVGSDGQRNLYFATLAHTLETIELARLSDIPTERLTELSIAPDPVGGRDALFIDRPAESEILEVQPDFSTIFSLVNNSNFRYDYTPTETERVIHVRFRISRNASGGDSVNIATRIVDDETGETIVESPDNGFANMLGNTFENLFVHNAADFSNVPIRQTLGGIDAILRAGRTYRIEFQIDNATNGQFMHCLAGFGDHGLARPFLELEAEFEADSEKLALEEDIEPFARVADNARVSSSKLLRYNRFLGTIAQPNTVFADFDTFPGALENELVQAAGNPGTVDGRALDGNYFYRAIRDTIGSSPDDWERVEVPESGGVTDLSAVEDFALEANPDTPVPNDKITPNYNETTGDTTLTVDNWPGYRNGVLRTSGSMLILHADIAEDGDRLCVHKVGSNTLTISSDDGNVTVNGEAMYEITAEGKYDLIVRGQDWEVMVPQPVSVDIPRSTQLLASMAATGQSSVTFDLPDGFRSFTIIGEGLNGPQGQSIDLQFGNNGTFVAGSAYQFYRESVFNNSTTPSNNTSFGAIRIVNFEGGSLETEIRILGTKTTNSRSAAIVTSIAHLTPSNLMIPTLCRGIISNNTAYSQARLSMSSGSYSAGNFYLYGDPA